MKRILSIIMIATFLTVSLPSFAEEKSKLGAVEDAAGDETSTTSTTSSYSAGDIAAQGVIEILMQFFMMGLAQTSADGFSGLYKELKTEESPLLPTIHIEPSYQYVKGGLHGVTGKLEAGYLILGVDGEYTRYFEKSPNNSLDIIRGHVLLRTMFARFFGTNLALGAKSIRGGQTRTSFEIGLPLYIVFWKHLYLDVQPFVATFGGKNTYDIDGGLNFKYKYFGARAGYRAFFVGGETLQGPRVSAFFQW